MRSLLVTLSLASVVLAQTSDPGSVRKITDSDELARLLKKESNAFFLDVREPAEIAELGSLKGYVNIPIGELEGRLKEIPRKRTIITA